MAKEENGAAGQSPRATEHCILTTTAFPDFWMRISICAELLSSLALPLELPTSFEWSRSYTPADPSLYHTYQSPSLGSTRGHDDSAEYVKKTATQLKSQTRDHPHHLRRSRDSHHSQLDLCLPARALPAATHHQTIPRCVLARPPSHMGRIRTQGPSHPLTTPVRRGTATKQHDPEVPAESGLGHHQGQQQRVPLRPRGRCARPTIPARRDDEARPQQERGDRHGGGGAPTTARARVGLEVGRGERRADVAAAARQEVAVAEQPGPAVERGRRGRAAAPTHRAAQDSAAAVASAFQGRWSCEGAWTKAHELADGVDTSEH